MQKNIDFGAFPDDPDADAIRSAFQKTQENFTEIFSDNFINRPRITAGAGITAVYPPGGNVIISANIACVQVVTSSLSIGRGANGNTSTSLTQSSQVLVLDINPNYVYSNTFAAVSGGLANLNGTLTLDSNSQPNITSVGTLISLDVIGDVTADNFHGNLSGNATTAGTVTTNAQPNITSVGTLTSLDVTGNVLAGNVYANSGTIGASLLTGTVTTNAQPNITSVGTLSSLAVTANVVSGNVYANSGTIGASLLTGTLTTNAQPNVTSVGTLSSLAVTANVVSGNVYANSGTIGASLLTGTLTTNAQPNVTSVGSLSELTVTGNASAGNISTTGKITATGNIAGGNVNAGNLLTANYLTGTLTTVAQPNITSVGTLSSLTVTANVISGNVYANAGTIGASLITGTLTTNAQPNVTSVGTLTSLGVAGNATAGNLSTGGTLNVTGNANVGNLGTVGSIAATGNITTNANVVTDKVIGRTSGVTITAVGTDQHITLVPTGTGSVDVSNAKIINLANPTSAQQAATRNYVETGAEVPDVYYVAKNGADTNNGKSLYAPFLTIKAACAAAAIIVNADAAARVTIFIKTGDYTELNPVTVPKRVTLIGDNLRAVSIRPANTAADTFYVNNGSYVAGVTFRSHLYPCAAIAFDPNGSAGAITTSPYIQNCSSITTTGAGARIDGNYTSVLKGMVMDAYTQFNQGGLGIHLLNGGYAQLVSIFTICTSIGILCESGGQCSVTNSNSSFGDYALQADGMSSSVDTGFSGAVDVPNNTIILTGLTSRPSTNDVVKFTGDVNYYTISTSTALLAGVSTVSIVENVPNPTLGTVINIYKRSLISTSGHTFEYVGSGTNLYTALPAAGGQPIQSHEIVEANGGKVFFTSTDQKGDFRVGSGFTIESATGTISGRTFNQSLFAVMTPYILALEG